MSTGGEGDKAKERTVSCSQWLYAPSSRQLRMRICYGCAVSYLIGGVCFVLLASPAEEGRWVWVDDELSASDEIWKQEDAITLNKTRQMMQRYEEDGTPPTFGITKGRASNANGTQCNKKLSKWCHGYCSMHGSQPPEPLLAPGRLGERRDLDHMSQCFIWYTNGFYSRPVGGRAGQMLSRLGPGVDNKGYFVRALREYEDKFGCEPYQVYPPTIELNETHTCFEFFYDNRKWAPSPDSLWFMKKVKGSTGRHISLHRRREIEAVAAKKDDRCPRDTAVASLEVPNIWTINNRKWDNRIYILVPSIEPYIILFREGHLRFSVFNHSEDATAPFQPQHPAPGARRLFAAAAAREATLANGGTVRKEEEEGEDAKKLPENDPQLARHVTNPRFGMAHTNDTNDVIKPVGLLREALVAQHGELEGEARYRRYQNSIRNAAQMVLHAVRNRHWGKNKKWGYLYLAMDVACDTDQNAHVLDLNSGPSFYHHHAWPSWFVQERSDMIREAADIIQEVTGCMLVRVRVCICVLVERGLGGLET